MAPRTQVHPQHHNPMLMSTVTTHNQINYHQNPNHNLHVTLLKTQTQINHAPPPQIKTQTHRLASLATDQRCWRWVWLRQREGDFCLGGSGRCRARNGWRWEKRRKGRKLTGLASEYGWTSNLRRSVGWSWVSLSSMRGGGVKVSLRMSFEVCEECVREVCEEWPIRKSIEGNMEREIHLRHGNWEAYFTVKLISIFNLIVFSDFSLHKTFYFIFQFDQSECKTFSDFSFHAKQTQL